MTQATRLNEKGPLRLNLSGAFIRRTSLARANLTGANLSNADCSWVDFREADFKDANLTGTILKGADLTGAKNLTREQIRSAVIDAQTRLPNDLAALV